MQHDIKDIMWNVCFCHCTAKLLKVRSMSMVLTQCGQLQVPSGAFSMSGSRQTMWYALGQVSHRMISPPCWHTSQQSWWSVSQPSPSSDSDQKRNKLNILHMKHMTSEATDVCLLFVIGKPTLSHSFFRDGINPLENRSPIWMQWI